jgi:hypothetical protein
MLFKIRYSRLTGSWTNTTTAVHLYPGFSLEASICYSAALTN